MNFMQSVTRKEFARALGISISNFDKEVKNGIIPAPYKLGGRAVRWRPETVIKFLESLINPYPNPIRQIDQDQETRASNPEQIDQCQEPAELEITFRSSKNNQLFKGEENV